tara:strand:- start:158 stop:514 length:357 start_codon:yes stop_codon:yes gene_type:complete
MKLYSRDSQEKVNSDQWSTAKRDRPVNPQTQYLTAATSSGILGTVNKRGEVMVSPSSKARFVEPWERRQWIGHHAMSACHPEYGSIGKSKYKTRREVTPRHNMALDYLLRHREVNRTN